MLSNIETGIRQGAINKDNKLYIDRDMPDYLPGLCWNIYMGERFIKKGNYQWMFSRSEIEYFSESLKDATWIIDKEDFSVIRKSSKDTFKKAKKIYSEKIEQFMNLANFYVDQKQYHEAEKMFKKAIEMNPKNDKAYIALGKCYKIQGKYKEAEEILNRPKEINLENN
jgi:tetratricopeptide (TPR) repeat protein